MRLNWRSLAATGAVAAIAAFFIIQRATVPRLDFKEPLSTRPLSTPPLPLAASTQGQPTAGSHAQYTNEMLNKMLQDESDRMGIKGIIVPHEAASRMEQQELVDKLSGPMTPEQAASAMQELSDMKNSVEAQNGKTEPVLIGGRTPKLLAAADVTGSSAPGSVPPTTFWSGVSRNFPMQNQAVVDFDTWRNLWRHVSADPVPMLDFNRQEVIAVCPGPRPEGSTVEIVSAESAGSAFLIRYHDKAAAILPQNPQNPGFPYALKVIPKTDLIVEFQEVP